jgi:hypothetical protein
VPLESRNANGYVLAFDNTNGTFTGVALNAVSAQQVNVPVTVRDDGSADRDGYDCLGSKRALCVYARVG